MRYSDKCEIASISFDQWHTEVGGRPFIVFQYTGDLPSSNSAQVGKEHLV